MMELWNIGVFEYRNNFNNQLFGLIDKKLNK